MESYPGTEFIGPGMPLYVYKGHIKSSRLEFCIINEFQ